MIDSFSGQHRFLSNFYPAPVGYEGSLYLTVEHAFQAAKTIDTFERQRLFEVTPGQAKRIGKTLKLRPNWENIKLDIMEELVRQKFEDPTLKAQLLATKDQALIEGNWWGDTFWGVYKGKGQNHLGKILMKIRYELGGT